MTRETRKPRVDPTLRTPWSQTIAVLYLILFAVVSLSLIPYPGPALDPHTYALVGGACAAVSLAFAVRGLALGIVVGGDAVLVRSWFRTRRLPRPEIVEIESAGYDGWLTGGRPSATLDTLQLRLRDGRTVTAWGIVGRPGTVHKRVVRLRALLGLPRRPAEPPRRRARARRARRGRRPS